MISISKKCFGLNSDIIRESPLSVTKGTQLSLQFSCELLNWPNIYNIKLSLDEWNNIWGTFVGNKSVNNYTLSVLPIRNLGYQMGFIKYDLY